MRFGRKIRALGTTSFCFILRIDYSIALFYFLFFEKTFRRTFFPPTLHVLPFFFRNKHVREYIITHKIRTTCSSRTFFFSFFLYIYLYLLFSMRIEQKRVVGSPHAVRVLLLYTNALRKTAHNGVCKLWKIKLISRENGRSVRVVAKCSCERNFVVINR